MSQQTLSLTNWRRIWAVVAGIVLTVVFAANFTAMVFGAADIGVRLFAVVATACTIAALWGAIYLFVSSKQ